ncbi:hypothetical protein AB4455_03480 [Vibrio sp. 10N.261.46.E12]|uniref:hypothetical protein n=1 Tax=unclassified Vibrio TaxID=2614977 RepID=UPI000975417A|nr:MULTISPECIES: hypothetical protein [unclassified Vibrio]OMO33114.1 hypothetical protein BH584_15415 [Vibrio sp. 10N.261.45.E1]PMJ34034.1 hypothetical protein BCU27_24835 [Vibrio sp. 10N.286.45.B6]PML84287.1 hypothetical protein BCT66_17825 [Vibrio sp. 10N.261.49.E11]PMM90293.1 hypothetical protein BCT46_23630 [Vibrio sp. 10N.261.46.E8]PMN47526.1 hypothetical protein BCT32_09465 [Vibrio sp. 10N.261.45.E11]
MKVNGHPKQLLIQLKKMAESSPSEIQSFANSRLKKINSAFFNNFDANAFVENLISRTEGLTSGTSDELPVISGIPITDFISYSARRLSESNDPELKQSESSLAKLQLDLLPVGDIAVMPSSIAITNSGDSSSLYIPTFGEMMLNEFADRMRESTKDHSSMMIPLIQRLNEVSIEYGSNSAHLAILGLRLSNGESSESLHELFTEQAAAAAITYLMENQVTTMSDTRFINLLNGAKDLNVNLANLCVRGTDVKLSTFLQQTSRDELFDRYDVASQRQSALSSLRSQEHRISNDYDPMACFDM